MSDETAERPQPETDGGVATDEATTHPTLAASLSLEALRPVLTVARQEYRLAIRRRWLVALAALVGLLAVVVVAFGGSKLGPARAEAVVVSLASLATYLLPLAALVYGYDAVVGAAEDGRLDVVYALPVPRSSVLAGTFLGRAVTLAVATALGLGAGGLALYGTVGAAVDWALYGRLLLGAVALGLAFLGVSVLVSTLAAAKTHALGGVLLVWVWFVFGHDLAALGLVAATDLPGSALSALVVANPATAFRLLVLSGSAASGPLAAVVSSTALTPAVLTLALGAWAVVPVAVAARLAGRRSL
jgi:Cu-processing system permease protein